MKLMKWEEAKKAVKNKNTFLMFSTEWCNDCKMMEPVILELEKKTAKDIQFIKVDAEEAKLFRDANAPIKVLKVPAFYVVKNNQFELIGYEYLPASILEAKL